MTVVTFIWKGERDYRVEHAAALFASVRRHATVPLRCVAIVDDARPPRVGPFEVIPTPDAARRLAAIPTPEGRRFPSSYRRLWLFSSEAKVLGPRVLLTDVDAVATGDWAPLIDRAEDFVGWRPRMVWGRPGEARLAGGAWLLRTGTRTAVYDEFTSDPARAIAAARRAGFRGSDQAWLSYKLARTAPVWPDGSGIYSVRDFLERDARGRPTARAGARARATTTTALPADARVVHFNGAEEMKPWHPIARRRFPWLAEHWPL